YAGTAEDPFPRLHCIKRNGRAWIGLRSKERIALEVAAKRVEESCLEISLDRSTIVVVRALYGSVVGAARLGTPLIFKLKSDFRSQVRCDCVVSLINELIAI